jgi:hypothetical protein
MWKQDWNPFYKPDPKEVVRKCQANIKKEVRNIERQMMGERRRPQRAQEVIRRRCGDNRSEASHCPGCPHVCADIERERKKAEKLIKDAAKRSDVTSARVRGRRGGRAAGRWSAPALPQ